MDLAKTFKNGRSQAIRLPKKYRIDSDEVYIKKYGNIIMLIPKNTDWKILEIATTYFSDDFMEDRKQSKTQERTNL